MNDRAISPPSLPVFVVVLAVLTFGVVLLGRYLGLGLDSFFLLAVPVAVAVAYLAWYRTLPLESPRARAWTEDDEPFEDPVEEADRLEEESVPAGPDEATAPAESDEEPATPP